MEQQIRFCTTTDGVRIAYAVTGSGPPLLWVPGWLSHLELDLTFPPFRERCESLAEDFTLIRFDKRGTGLSQRGIAEFSLEIWVRDLEAVVAALQLDRFALLGYSEGGPISIAYTTRHSERVSHLVLTSTFANATGLFGGPEIQRGLTAMTRKSWGLGSGVLAEFFLGEGIDPVVQRQFALYEQQASNGADAVINAEAALQLDVRELLPNVNCPTLVLHPRADHVVPIELGQELAAGITGARFVSVDGPHIPDSKQMAQMDAAIREFLGASPRRAEPAAPASSPVHASLVTIMFTDIEGSTTLTQRLGDAGAQDILRAHNTVIRDALAAHSGTKSSTPATA